MKNYHETFLFLDKYQRLNKQYLEILKWDFVKWEDVKSLSERKNWTWISGEKGKLLAKINAINFHRLSLSIDYFLLGHAMAAILTLLF